MNKKIIFFDVDGTIVDFETKEVSPQTRNTLLKLQERGHIVVVATGRPMSAVPKIEGFEFDAYLTFTGSLCRTKDEIIFKSPMHKEDVKQLVDNVRKLPSHMAIATLDRIKSTGHHDDLKEYLGFAKIELIVSDDLEALLEEDIYQGMVAVTLENRHKLLENTSQIKISHFWDLAVDVVPISGGKALGVEKILDYYNLEKEDAIAFGDGSNDIDMFSAVGHGVAMENASDDLKAVADAICPSVADEGVSQYCLEIGLI